MPAPPVETSGGFVFPTSQGIDVPHKPPANAPNGTGKKRKPGERHHAPTKETQWYIGIDPGVTGGLAVIDSSGGRKVSKMPETEADVWDWICAAVGFDEDKEDPDRIEMRTMAVIEEQRARPTNWFDPKAKKWTGSILKSTCMLYGSYSFLRGLLTAAGVRFVAVMPQDWQKGLGIPPKKKGETPTRWKNRLKAEAQRLFPPEKVTLATADALLIAEYCRRRREGTL